MAKVKVKAIKNYSDIVLHRIVEKDEVLEVDKARADHLVNEGMVKVIKATGETKESE